MLDWCAREIDAAAMRLILLRHAKSEKAVPGMSDHARSLNPRGRRDIALIGAYMAHHGLAPDLAAVSPARRTRETWECLLAAFATAPPVVFDERLYNARGEAIVAAIKQIGGTAHTLLVLGHNPGLHDCARLLIASGDVEARERLNESLPTSALVVIDFAGEDWRKLHQQGGRIEHFVSPRMLADADRV
jgi:phosphohistidine phosphatase